VTTAAGMAGLLPVPPVPRRVYKIYAESLLSEDHLQLLREEAQEIVSRAFRAAGV